MGFSEGTEDEFLLTCFVCKEPFGMLAAFCGGCGARRDQAMGIERARSTQQISQNTIETPSFEETIPVSLEKPERFPTPFDSLDNSSPSSNLNSTAVTTPVKKKKKKSIKRQIFVSNIRLRIEALDNWQSRRARLLNFSGIPLFLIATYLFTQSFIVGTSNPANAAEQYLKEAVTYDSHFFAINSEDQGAKKLPIFPVRYLKKVGATDWLYTTKTRGLQGTAEVTIVPSGSQYDTTPITLPMKAKYKKVLGIFRSPEWVPAGSPATVTIDYPNSSNTLIYINGFAAGDVANPVVKEGTYLIFPGHFEVKFYRNGEETSDSFAIDISTTGDY